MLPLEKTNKPRGKCKNVSHSQLVPEFEQMEQTAGLKKVLVLVVVAV